MDLELTDHAFLVTGGTDGLGLALAKKLVSEGARVAVCGRDQDRLDQAQGALGDRALCVRADVTKETELDGFIDTALTSFGRLDGAVNNAGRSAGTPVASSDDQMWRDDLELKVISAVHISRRVLPALEASNGSLINVLAILGRTPPANSTPTSASRAAGLALTKALANEVGARGIRVNAILIGLIESGQWVRRAEDAHVPLEQFYATMAENSKIPLGRIGRADEFADLAAFLLSPRASYITGVGISIDGGLSSVI
ncbi:MAG: SDR family oxidoreductase [Acidimicrobiales bacterium]|jgi:NAD(P)-dependent dehydrogenase (short-subunit alcohol dehydrogenase family)